MGVMGSRNSGCIGRCIGGCVAGGLVVRLVGGLAGWLAGIPARHHRPKAITTRHWRSTPRFLQ